MYTVRLVAGGAALDESVLVDPGLVEDAVGTQLSGAEVWPARRRDVDDVDVYRDAVQVDDAEVQAVVDALRVLVLRRSRGQLIVVLLPLVLLACHA